MEVGEKTWKNKKTSIISIPKELSSHKIYILIKVILGM